MSLKILCGHGCIRFGTSQSGIAFCYLHTMIVVILLSSLGCPITELDGTHTISFWNGTPHSVIG
jgi:hypothetical protein